MKPRNLIPDGNVSGLVSLKRKDPVQCVEWKEEGLKADSSLPHCHPYDEILFFSAGSGNYLLEETIYPIVGDSVLFIRKGQKHAVTPSHELEGGHIIFDSDQLITDRYLPFKTFFHNRQLSEWRIDLAAEEFAEIWSIFLQIKALNSSGKKVYLREYSLTYFNLLLLKLADAISLKKESVDVLKQPALAQRFRRLVESQYFTVRSVEEYARQLHICPKYLHEVCKKAFGQSPSQVINECLAEEIRHRLIHSTQSLKEIAYQLKFNDQAYFNRFFKKMTGMTPGCFRRKSKN